MCRCQRRDHACNYTSPVKERSDGIPVYVILPLVQAHSIDKCLRAWLVLLDRD